MKHRRLHALAAAGLLSLAALLGLPAAAGPLAALDGASGWINSPPLDEKALRGRVVLLDFWTYSCINCLRTLPYLRAWAQKYGPNGLVVIGAHTPEFDFERDPARVRRAAKDLGIGWPVAIDSRQSIWNALGTRAWPSLYFIDSAGRLRHTQLGEGRYDEAERLIQRLLREAGRANVPDDLVRDPPAGGTQAAAGARAAMSEETYLGSARADARFSAATGAPALAAERWTLAGRWRAEPELIESTEAGARIAYRFRARDLHLVMGPANDTRPLRFRVRIDGKPPGADHGADTDAEGFGTLDSQRLYQLLRQSSGRPDERLFEIEFLAPGARAWAFTFG